MKEEKDSQGQFEPLHSLSFVIDVDNDRFQIWTRLSAETPAIPSLILI
jgi:hypothetical protein